MAEWKKIIVSGSQAELAGVTGSFTGSFFGDGSGLTNLPGFTVKDEVDNRLITSLDAGLGQAEENLTFDGTLLTVTGNALITGDLTVSGDLINLNVTNLAVEDQFILLGSGSDSNLDKGIIFDNFNGTPNQGVAFYWDADDQRLAYAESVNHDTIGVTPQAYIPLVFDVDGVLHSPKDTVGNIKIESGEAFIYI